MNTFNQFSNSQLDVFRNEGWTVYSYSDGSMTQIVKYNDTIPLAPLLIQLDYKNQRLLVIEQNIFNYKEAPEPRYNALLPEDISDTIYIINKCQVINELLKARLNANRL